MIANVTVRGSVTAQLERRTGCACTKTILAALFRAVEDASKPRSNKAVLSDDMFSCFVALPTALGEALHLRIYWQVDAATGQKVVVRIKPGRAN